YLIDFWYIECIPYKKDHEVIAKYYANNPNKNIKTIGMYIDKKED
ncbi:MAG: hypothetical protein ACI9YE_003632, partial [Psychroserpens sp.]